MNTYLGTYSIDDWEWIEFTYTVKNVGGGTLYWFIEDFVWWIGYITIGGLQGYSGSCAAGQTKEFTIHVCTDWLEAPMPNVNVYVGQINITSNGGDVSPTVKIGMLDPLLFEQTPFPSNLEKGDILSFDIKQEIADLLNLRQFPGFSNDHVVMYIGSVAGVQLFIESNDYSVFHFPWSPLNGVQITPWCIFSLYADEDTFLIGKVHVATEQQKLKAIGFSFSRLFDQYQWGSPDYDPYHSWHANPDITDHTNPFYEKYQYPDDPYIDYWYCYELIWAAYLHQEIEIDGDPTLEYDDILQDYFYCIGVDDFKISDNVTICSPTWDIIHDPPE